MSERLGYAPPEASAETASSQIKPMNGHENGRVNGNGHHETAFPLQGTIELGALAAATEVDFGVEIDVALPSEGTIFDRETMCPAVAETPPKGWHKALMRAQERDWNKRKRTQRLDNYAHAHGQFINTGSGRQYRDHGIPRPNQNK